jgi:hypothetical protein
MTGQMDGNGSRIHGIEVDFGHGGGFDHWAQTWNPVGNMAIRSTADQTDQKSEIHLDTMLQASGFRDGLILHTWKRAGLRLPSAGNQG